MIWKRKFILVGGLATLLVAGGLFTAWSQTRGQGQPDVFDQMHQISAGVPQVVATVNGQDVDKAAYVGALATATLCTQTGSCGYGQQYERLGPANVAITLTVDHVLVSQYGTAHGVTVSDQEIDEAIAQQQQFVQQALAQGGQTAEQARKNLAQSGMTSPDQMSGNAKLRAYERDQILVTKTLKQFAGTQGSSADPEADFAWQLQQDATIVVKAPGAHMLDPHELHKNADAPPPPPTPPPFVGVVTPRAGSGSAAAAGTPPPGPVRPFVPGQATPPPWLPTPPPLATPFGR